MMWVWKRSLIFKRGWVMIEKNRILCYFILVSIFLVIVWEGIFFYGYELIIFFFF